MYSTKPKNGSLNKQRCKVMPEPTLVELQAQIDELKNELKDLKKAHKMQRIEVRTELGKLNKKYAMLRNDLIVKFRSIDSEQLKIRNLRKSDINAFNSIIHNLSVRVYKTSKPSALMSNKRK